MFRSLIAALALATLGQGALAAPLTITVGDNDGYGGLAIPDNGPIGGAFMGSSCDGRSAAEAVATNGAEITDVFTTLTAGGPSGKTFATVYFPYAGVLTAASIRIEMADLDSAAFGALEMGVNGFGLPFGFNDGQNSVTRDFALNPTMLLAANLAGAVELNISRGGSTDNIAFDYSQLTGEATTSAVPLPATLPLLLAGIGLIALRRRA